MKVTILSQYYLPEIGAPQNRLSEVAQRLKKLGVEVDVLTAMPNYPTSEIYAGYRGKFYQHETVNDISVHRSWIFVSRSKNLFLRVLNYFSFCITSFFISFFVLRRGGILLLESPPIFLGITAILVSRLKSKKLVSNISDLWPESAEKLGLISNRFLLDITERLELKLYKSSHLVTCQTKGIEQSINRRVPSAPTIWHPNGVDVELYRKDNFDRTWRVENGFSDEDFLIGYAGIHGFAQGLEVIINAAERLSKNSNCKFIFLGSGPEKEGLQKLVKDKNLSNVSFFNPVQKGRIPYFVNSIDSSIVPLKKLDLFLGAIPSKIFEVLAMEKPILLGVDGEARDLFINEGKAGLYFEPENDEQLAAAILKLSTDKELYKELSLNAKNYVTQHFNRDVIAQDLYNALKRI